ncbi:MAG: HAD family hydrolase [Desulfobacterales bacterium]|nr:HAD family hydrolase [Desulfobacterales bacterium]
MKQINTVILDFDGTLADTRGAIKQAFQETLHDLDISFPAHTSIEELSCQTLDNMFQGAGVSNQRQLSEAISCYQDKYKKISPEKSGLFPGVSETLEALCEEGVNLAIATNENRGNLELLAKVLNIDHYFGATLCEDEVFCPKPHPEMAYRIMEEMDSSPFSTLVVGDSVLDMKMARTAGCYTCAVAYGTCSAEKLRKQSPDRIIHRFEELAEIPDKWIDIRGNG